MKKIFLTIIILIVLQLVFFSQGASFGDSSATLEEKINSIRKENQQIELEISSLSSCSAVAQRAAELNKAISANIDIQSADSK